MAVIVTKLELTPWKGNEELLQEWIMEKLDSGTLPLHNNKVKRKALQELLRLPTNSLVNHHYGERWAWLRGFLDKFDHYLLKRAESEFKEKLHSLWEAGELPLYRGTVSQARLAELTNLPLSLFKENGSGPNWASNSIAEFNNYLRQQGQGTVWELKVPEIRAYLDQLHKSNQLPVNQSGRLNRVAVLSAFGLSERGSPWVVERRAPLLKDLLDGYDKKVIEGEYSQYKYDYLKNELQTILDSEVIPLSYGRIINLVAIGKILGVSKGALSSTPCLHDQIQKKQEEIDKGLRRGKTERQFSIGGLSYMNLGATPWSERHERVFDFALLIEPYSLEFAEKVGTVFIHIVDKLANPKASYSDLKKFLTWISTKESLGEIVNSLSNGSLPESSAFERAVLTYQQLMLAEFQEKAGKASTRQALPCLAVISKFSDARVFPRISIPSLRSRTLYLRKNKDRNSKPSLVEAQQNDVLAIRNIAEQTALYRGIEFDDSKDTIAFVNTLALERARRDDLPLGLVEAIAFLCDERLYELRTQSTKVFRQWYETYQRGRILIANAHKTGEIIKQELEALRRGGSGWKKKVAELFPERDPQRALANLLALIENEFDGLCPDSAKAEWGQFWRKSYSKCGGTPHVQSHLLPSSAAVSAAICLYLCESGANCSVGLVLEPSSIRPSKLPGHVNIVSTKARSKGKSIFNDLPVSSGFEEVMSASEALTILKDVTQPLRDRGLIKGNELLVFASRASLRRLEEWQLRAEIQAIADSSNLLTNLTITPSMIRPTVLLSAELKNPGNLSAANIIAQHKDESTTMGYVRKLPYRIILEDRIRGFMNTLQVVIASSLQEGHTKLGITVEEVEVQIQHSKRTGLGIFCSNPFSGAQSDYPAGVMCKAIDRCIECSKRIVVAHDESIADMMIWQEALNKVQDQWLEERYQRWEEIWTPWQAFFHVVLNEKMARGELAAIKKRASEIVNKRKKSQDFRYPEPW